MCKSNPPIIVKSGEDTVSEFYQKASYTRAGIIKIDQLDFTAEEKQQAPLYDLCNQGNH